MAVKQKEASEESVDRLGLESDEDEDEDEDEDDEEEELIRLVPEGGRKCSIRAAPGDDEEVEEGETEEGDEEDGAGDVDGWEAPGDPFLIPSHYGRRWTALFAYPPELNETIRCPSEVRPHLTCKFHWHRKCVSRTLARSGFSPVQDSTFLLYFGMHFGSNSIFRALQPFQKVGHFPGTSCIGRKDRLSRLLDRFQRAHPLNFDFHPASFVLPGEASSLLRFLSASQSQRREAPSLSSSTRRRCRRPLLIRKPPASACGRGIRVLSAHSARRQAQNSTKSCIVQQYLDDPLLIGGFKFDLRVYVLVTSFDPLRVYIFQEGLVRFATEKYSRNCISNRFVHLTNTAVNEKNPNYKVRTDGKEEEREKGDVGGSKWCFEDLKRVFKHDGLDYDALWRDIDSLVVKTMIAADSEVSLQLHSCVRMPQQCHEVFGFDVLIDRHLKPWLIEVNIAPALRTASPLDRRVKDTLVADIFTLIGVEPLEALPPRQRAAVLQRIGSPPAEGPPQELAGTLPEFREAVVAMEEEFHRKGHFRRVFPTADSRADFFMLFDPLRPSTIACVEFLERQSGKSLPLFRPVQSAVRPASTPSRRLPWAGQTPENPRAAPRPLPVRRSISVSVPSAPFPPPARDRPRVEDVPAASRAQSAPVEVQPMAALRPSPCRCGTLPQAFSFAAALVPPFPRTRFGEIDRSAPSGHSVHSREAQARVPVRTIRLSLPVAAFRPRPSLGVPGRTLSLSQRYY